MNNHLDYNHLDYIEYFNNQLLKYIQNYKMPAPILKEALEYTLFPGGKRLRPLLVYYCGDILNIEREILTPLAIAIELIHTYSLIHDDLPAMDNDDFRRGQLSCHKKFDEASAILLGDGLQPMAIEALMSLKNNIPAQNLLSVIDSLVEASGFQGMVSGQSLDLNELQENKDVAITVDDLKNVHHLKTTSLIKACIDMVIAVDHGNINGNENIKETEKSHLALKEFATNFGLLFQIIDDYLDKFQVQSLKKGRSSDFENKKITFVNLFSQDELLNLIDMYHQKTLNALNKINGNTTSLQNFVSTIIKRID